MDIPARKTKPSVRFENTEETKNKGKEPVTSGEGPSKVPASHDDENSSILFGKDPVNGAGRKTVTEKKKSLTDGGEKETYHYETPIIKEANAEKLLEEILETKITLPSIEGDLGNE